MGKTTSQKFRVCRFYAESGPEHLFERVKYIMGAKSNIKVDRPHFVRRVRERGIPREVVRLVNNFNVRRWKVLSAEVRSDTGKFISSTWECVYNQRYYVVTIGLGDVAETIYESEMPRNRKRNLKKGNSPANRMYDFVEMVNRALMESVSGAKENKTLVTVKNKKDKNFSIKTSSVEGDWKVNPFDGLENILPVNVVKIDEWSKVATQIGKNPIKNWPERYSAKAKIFKAGNTTKDFRHFVRSLVNTAKDLTDFEEEPDLLFVDGACLEESDGWVGVFSSLLAYLAVNKADDLTKLDMAGQMNWLAKSNSKASLSECIIADGVSAEFGCILDLCAKMQWLLMMTGFNLNDVAIRFKRSDEQICAIQAKQRETRAAETSAAGGSRAKRTSSGVSEREVIPGASSSDGHSTLGDDHISDPSSCQQMSSTNSFNTVRFDRGTYIVQDGVVVFLNRHDDLADDDNGSRVMHSDVDFPDGWKGFGVARPESDGRFGGIIAEDHSD